MPELHAGIRHITATCNTQYIRSQHSCAILKVVLAASVKLASGVVLVNRQGQGRTGNREGPVQRPDAGHLLIHGYLMLPKDKSQLHSDLWLCKLLLDQLQQLVVQVLGEQATSGVAS